MIRIGATRVTLESVIGLFEQGASPEEIALRFDALGLPGIYATLSYSLGHRREVQEYLDRQSQSSAQARREAERRFPADQVRERIAQRRNRCSACWLARTLTAATLLAIECVNASQMNGRILYLLL